ncbi:MAG: Processive diacylglycerol beta-glucosyltransferase [Chlamydiae bacterium]|nr:Processive diacylglycerol beta-glucosyltransferase [Chlamydiota bacterium]
MVFRLKSASDHLLSHWTRSPKPNEDYLQQTLDFLDELKGVWIADEEYCKLKTLLDQKKTDLVYRYLELQLHLRSSEEKNRLHVSIELEKTLENYLKNADESRLNQEIALRSMEQILGDWFVSLGLMRPPIAMHLDEGNFGTQVQHSLVIVMKEEGFKLLPQDRIFVEDILTTKDDSLEYWNRICTCFEQLLLWEEILNDILKSIHDHPRSDSFDFENLQIQLDFFEKELLVFYKQLGKILSENILKPFSELSTTAIMGKFRKKFTELNHAYAELKSALFQMPLDIHLCCSCHFSEEFDPHWDPKTRVVDLREIKPFYTHSKSTKDTLLVFTCAGGRGHLSVTKAISEYARGKYHVQVANTLEETLASTDVFKRMLLNFSQERLYNHLLRNEEFEWLKVVTSVGPFFLMMQQESIERQIRQEVLRHSPDLLITCFPTLNAMFLNVAKELDLPLLMVTTDLDTDLFTRGMHERSCDLSYSKWRMTLAYDTPQMRSIMEKRIPQENIHVSGFPVRSAFNKDASDMEKGTLRQKFEIQPEDKVLIVMIGGMAGRATEKYATILSEITDSEVAKISKANLHIICLCGDQKMHESRDMRMRIDALKCKSKKIHMHAIGSYDRVSTLMSIADALITKPGGCTTNEALAKGLPMIFHAPFALMDWEVFNMEFSIQAEMGARFKLQSNSLFQDGMTKNKQRLLPLIEEAFARRKQKPHYPFEMKDFGKELIGLIETFID